MKLKKIPAKIIRMNIEMRGVITRLKVYCKMNTPMIAINNQ
jgi:hypothetical protein